MNFFKRIVKNTIKNAVNFGKRVVVHVKPLTIMIMATIGITGRLVRVGVRPNIAMSASVLGVIGLCL
jgi:hypothetical protein